MALDELFADLEEREVDPEPVVLGADVTRQWLRVESEALRALLQDLLVPDQGCGCMPDSLILARLELRVGNLMAIGGAWHQPRTLDLLPDEVLHIALRLLVALSFITALLHLFETRGLDDLKARGLDTERLCADVVLHLFNDDKVDDVEHVLQEVGPVRGQLGPLLGSLRHDFAVVPQQ